MKGDGDLACGGSTTVEAVAIGRGEQGKKGTGEGDRLGEENTVVGSQPLIPLDVEVGLNHEERSSLVCFCLFPPPVRHPAWDGDRDGVLRRLGVLIFSIAMKPAFGSFSFLGEKAREEDEEKNQERSSGGETEETRSCDFLA